MNHRRLTIEEYRHVMDVWEFEDNPRFCKGNCWPCEVVARPMADGEFLHADTEDGVPIWMLPDEYLPEDAAEAYAEYLKSKE